MIVLCIYVHMYIHTYIYIRDLFCQYVEYSHFHEERVNAISILHQAMKGLAHLHHLGIGM